MNRADRLAVVFVVLGLVAVAGCGLSDGSKPVNSGPAWLPPAAG